EDRVERLQVVGLRLPEGVCQRSSHASPRLHDYPVVAMAVVYPTCNALVADLPGVRWAIRAAAAAIRFRAEAMLAEHLRTGNAKITVESHDKDAIVALDDAGDR